MPGCRRPVQGLSGDAGDPDRSPVYNRTPEIRQVFADYSGVSDPAWRTTSCTAADATIGCLSITLPASMSIRATAA